MTGYVKIWRSVMYNDTLDTVVKKLVFIAAIIRANHAPATVKGIKLKRGEFSTSYQKFAVYCGGKRSTIIDALKEIENDNMIRIKNHDKCVVIQVVKYDDWQISEPKPYDNRTITVTKPSENRQKTVKIPVTNKKKEERRKKKEIYIAEFFSVSDEVNSFFGPAPVSTLERWKEIYDSKNFCDAAENIMDCLKADNKKKYKNYISTLNNWLKNNNATRNDYKKYQEYETGQKLLAELNEVQRQCNEEYEKQQNG